MRIGNRIVALFLLTAMGLLSACSAPKTEEGLRKRVGQYWDYRVAGDWKSVYDFYIAEEKRNIPFEKFIEERNGKIQLKIVSYEIESVKTEGDKGESKVKFKWNLELPIKSEKRTQTGSESLLQHWRYENGAWYFTQINR